MASRAFESLLEDTKQSLWIIWAGVVASVPLFGVYGYFITSQEVPMTLPTWYQVGIGGAVLVMGSMAYLVPRKMLSNRVIMEHVRQKARESLVNAKAPAKESNMAPREERLASLIGAYKKPFVMSLALGNMVALLGLVYVLLSAQIVPMLLLMAIAIGLHVVNRPALDELTQRATKYLPDDRPPPTAWPTQQSEW